MASQVNQAKKSGNAAQLAYKLGLIPKPAATNSGGNKVGSNKVGVKRLEKRN